MEIQQIPRVSDHQSVIIMARRILRQKGKVPSSQMSFIYQKWNYQIPKRQLSQPQRQNRRTTRYNLALCHPDEGRIFSPSKSPSFTKSNQNTMEDLLLIIKLIKQQQPSLRIICTDLEVCHHFTLAGLIQICNQYHEAKTPTPPALYPGCIASSEFPLSPLPDFKNHPANPS